MHDRVHVPNKCPFQPFPFLWIFLLVIIIHSFFSLYLFYSLFFFSLYLFYQLMRQKYHPQKLCRKTMAIREAY
ncbi:hypothetical protein PHAVU_002G274600 [Phaseolus vulgaris]|uniref:Uncharacterized protein n=1 Tax=Phaseolus vulgaris TaxID=3885 RepID=V7CSG3_PHAVU|nr:hypothetical protein PHAVU_002G274600g [Phaseolus vulgaris]ESW31861.1 hypothetical protein PHAVU_002G274600g [Phaseolus vulgaris]